MKPVRLDPKVKSILGFLAILMLVLIPLTLAVRARVEAGL